MGQIYRLKMIYFWWEYLILYERKLVTYSNNWLLGIIISYWEPYDCVQTNDYFAQSAGAVEYIDCISEEG